MALKGVRVVEMAGLAPVPFCGKVLHDFGASVVRVNKMHELDVDRLARGKRSIALDLKHPAGIEVVRKLCGSSDVLIEPFRPGVMERLGLGPDVLTTDNPRLIYARLTGYGQTGPAAGWAGHDINYLAMSGVLWALKRPDEPPVPPVNIVADFAGGGLTCAFGIVAALLERSRSGVGQVVDCSMTEGAAYVSSWLFRSRDLTWLWGQSPGSNLLDGGSFFYGCYATCDGGYMAVGPLEPTFFSRFTELLGLPELDQFPDDPADARRQVAAVFLTRSRDEWTAVFSGQDACVTPVLTLDEAASGAHAQQRSSFERCSIMGSDCEPVPAPHLQRTPAALGSDSEPRPGQHSVEVLTELGYQLSDVQQMLHKGVVQQQERQSKL